MMNRLYKTLSILLSFIVITACEDIVEGINDNPNNPTDASISLMLTGIEVANIAVQSGHPARVASIWSGYLRGADRQHSAINSYIIDGDSFDQTWEKIYANIIGNGNLIIDKAAAIDNRLVMGITKVIQANILGTATAVFGDIPFSQADNTSEFPNPAFDAQTDVYTGLQNLLDDAILDLETGRGSIDVAEIYFGGDGAKWLEVAHTLKARYYLESRQYQLAYDEALMGISSLENSLMAPHGSTAGQNENLYHAFLEGGRSGDIDASGTYITQILDSTNPLYRGNAKTDEEARFNYYFKNIDDPANITPNTEGTNAFGGVFAVDASYPLVTYQENLLILAESALRAQGLTAGLEALNDYRSFMNEGGYLNPAYQTEAYSAVYLPYENADLQAGGMLNADGSSPEEALLNDILMERYIVFFGQINGFNDIRRSRAEGLGVQPPPNAGSELPERFIYSQAEINSNTNAPDDIPGIFVKTPINNL
ncbi:SusD/RagB family nutrient-binding outer membrane lipoprotein [Catalinimonas sp. 4WD22]|uniref:SusD/RagB family nutrient-binding outer membrane lipoprotein n=1 Tax=Catalinimonas locisalis TaxID=3133978 RepID=UPI0031017592